MLLQRGQDETIDRVADPARIRVLPGQGGPSGRDERPERLVFGPGRDPGLELLLLDRGKLLVDRRRRHDFVVVGGEDAVDHFALVRLAGHDSADLDGHLPPVEPQVGLSRGTVRPVAGKAVFGQDRPDVAIEAQLFGRRGNEGREHHQRCDCPRPRVAMEGDRGGRSTHRFTTSLLQEGCQVGRKKRRFVRSKRFYSNKVSRHGKLISEFCGTNRDLPLPFREL